MMNIDLYYLVEYALPLANVCLLAAATLVVVRLQRVLAGKAIYSRLAAGNAIEAQVADIDEHCRIVSERLGEIQDQIERFSHLERLLIGPVSREFPMEHAARLAKGGASVDELTRNCGLNIGEARLIRRLHGQAEASQLS
jgi:hypothetical protein